MASNAERISGRRLRLMSRRIVVKNFYQETADIKEFPLSIADLELLGKTPASKAGAPEYRSGITFPIWASACSIMPFESEMPGVVYCDFPVVIEKHSANRYCVKPF